MTTHNLFGGPILEATSNKCITTSNKGISGLLLVRHLATRVKMTPVQSRTAGTQLNEIIVANQQQQSTKGWPKNLA